MHYTVNSALILWYHGIILACDHLKHITSTVFMALVYRTANLLLNIK